MNSSTSLLDLHNLEMIFTTVVVFLICLMQFEVETKRTLIGKHDWMGGENVEKIRGMREVEKPNSKHDKVISIRYCVILRDIANLFPVHPYTQSRQTSQFLSFPIQFHLRSFHLKNNIKTAKWMLRRTPSPLIIIFIPLFFFNLKSNNIY